MRKTTALLTLPLAGMLALTACGETVLEGEGPESDIQEMYEAEGFSEDEYNLSCPDVTAEVGEIEECTAHFEDYEED